MASSIVLSFVGQQDPYSENTSQEGSIATLIRHLLSQKYSIRRVILLHTEDVAQKASDTRVNASKLIWQQRELVQDSITKKTFLNFLSLTRVEQIKSEP